MKDNKVFATLSGIGIIMVVIAHVDGVINLFNDFFPYNSFFMPMFMFISGYFFKDSNTDNVKSAKKYIKKKIVNLLIYYFIWNFTYGLIELILYKLNLHTWKIEFNLKNLFITPFINGQQFWINAPAWFLPTLVTVEVVFLGIRKLQILIKHNSEWITLLLMFFISMLMVYFSQSMLYNYLLLPFVKMGFFIFFFQLGKIYKDKLEEKEIRIPNIYVIVITLIVNIFLIKIYKDINFASLYDMSGFKNLPPYLPIITSITGIWFWLRISKIISPILSNSKYFMNISNNTKSIMMHHVFFMLILNIILYYTKDILYLDGFDVIKFKNSPMWYRYYADTIQLGVIYVAVGIIGPLMISKIENNVKKLIVNKIEKIKFSSK